MKISNPITREFGVLVGGVAKKELAARVNQIASDLPLVGSGIVNIDFQPILRDAGKLVARPHPDVADSVGEGIIGRAQCKGAHKGGVDETIIDARLPLVVTVAEAGLDPLAPGVADILEEAHADDVAWNAENLTCGIGTKKAEIP